MLTKNPHPDRDVRVECPPRVAGLMRGPIPTDMDDDNMTRPGTGYRLYP